MTRGEAPWGREELEYVDCDLCGRDDTQFLFRARDMWSCCNTCDATYYDFVQCRHCKLVYLNPRVPEEHIAAFYKTDYVAHSGKVREPVPLSPRGLWAARWRLARFRTWQGMAEPSRLRRMCLPIVWHSRRLRYDPLRFPGEGRRILDVGCGIGNYLADKRMLGWEACGIESAETAAAICRTRGLDVQQGTLGDCRFPPDSFDAVTLLQVLEHVPSPRQLLCQIRKLLKDDGILYLTVPNVRSIPATCFKQYWIGAADAPRHYYLFSPRVLGRLLEETDFVVLDQYTLSSTSGYTATLEFYLRERLGARVKRDKMRKNAFLSRLAIPLVRCSDWFGIGDNLHMIARKKAPSCP